MNQISPLAFVHPEASDNLLEVLRGASIDEEHRTIMSAVIEKVRSAKSGLTEACASLLTGFEVSNHVMRKYHSIDSSPWYEPDIVRFPLDPRHSSAKSLLTGRETSTSLARRQRASAERYPRR